MNKNRLTPLSIIAIFASLAEISASIVLVQLPDALQGTLIYFVMGFPLVLILLFFITLWKDPSTLYSPIEYKNEENFVLLRNKIIQIKEKINEDDSLSKDKKNELTQDIEIAVDELEEITDTSKSISIKINGVIIHASSVKPFYKKVFSHLMSKNIKFDSIVPFKTGSKRYLINTENKHIDGNEFIGPFKLGNYYLEANKSKRGAKSDIIKFLKALDLDVDSL